MQGRNNNLESLYNDIFENIYPQIQNNGRGVLHTVIYIILEAEKTQAEKICHFLNIKEYTYLEEDFKFANGVAKPVKSHIKQLINKQQQRDKEMKNWIVITACILVGVLGCIKFIEDTKSRQGRQQPRDNRRPPEPENFVPVAPLQSAIAALCLVVPAYVASKVKGQSQIDSYEIEKLIDNASYFLCTKVPDAELIRLAVTNESFLDVGEQREVYIRIHIADGQEMLDKELPYILKRNIPSHGQGVVKQLACLEDLSGLEKFNRV